MTPREHLSCIGNQGQQKHDPDIYVARFGCSARPVLGSSKTNQDVPGHQPYCHTDLPCLDSSLAIPMQTNQHKENRENDHPRDW